MSSSDTRSLSVAGVPDHVDHADVVMLIEALGFDVQHLFSLEFRPEAIYAGVWAVDEKGYRFFTGGYDDDGMPVAAMHSVAIPIHRPDDDDQEPPTTSVSSNYDPQAVSA